VLAHPWVRSIGSEVNNSSASHLFSASAIVAIRAYLLLIKQLTGSISGQSTPLEQVEKQVARPEFSSPNNETAGIATPRAPAARGPTLAAGGPTN